MPSHACSRSPTVSRSPTSIRSKARAGSTRCSSTTCAAADAGARRRGSPAARAAPAALAAKAESDLLIALAPHVEDFLAALFGIAPDVRALEARHHELAPLFAVKRQFVQRKAMNAYKADVAATFDGPALRAALEAAIGAPFSELAFAQGGDALAERQRTTSRPMPRRSTSRCATRRGPRTRRQAAPRIAAACCSARRASSTT